MGSDSTPLRKHLPIIPVVCTVIGVLAGAFAATWHSSAWFTGLQDSIVSVRAETTQQLGYMDHRVTALEDKGRAADQQFNATAAAIAGLQAQMSGVQGSLNDLKSSIDGIRSDIGTMARTANAPIRR